MSLDVYLRNRTPVLRPGLQLFVREAGQVIALSREEWDRRHPDREPVVVVPERETPYDLLYTANITHNLGQMAQHAGLYGVLWHPETCGIATAADLQGPLGIGLDVLRAQPDWFAQWNPRNGWGTYGTLVEFTAAYRGACLQWPEATVEVWR